MSALAGLVARASAAAVAAVAFPVIRRGPPPCWSPRRPWPTMGPRPPTRERLEQAGPQGDARTRVTEALVGERARPIAQGVAARGEVAALEERRRERV